MDMGVENRPIRFAMAQIDTFVGDIAGNCEKVIKACQKAKAKNADIVVCPEMTLTGYPTDDLVFKDSFRYQASDASRQLAAALKDNGLGDLYVFVGSLGLGSLEAQKGKIWYATDHNRLFILHDGEIFDTYDKHYLPTYGVFDELRLFAPGDKPLTVELFGKKFGVAICEDIWREGGTVGDLRGEGIDLLVSINGSPYNEGKMKTRYGLAVEKGTKLGCPVMYVNQVGGQDDLVFDGGSFVMDGKGKLFAQARQFAEDLIFWDLGATPTSSEDAPQEDVNICRPLGSLDDQVYANSVLGLKDYAHKNGFDKAIVGLSGGIDSALCAEIAADALGKENVTCIFMPSSCTSAQSAQDAREFAGKLGCKFEEIPISTFISAFDTLGLKDGAEENLHSRIRGMILMSYSNQNGGLVINCANKSEMATGYFTMYGDSVGAYSPICDIYKSRVYKLAAFKNEHGGCISESMLTKEPSAELHAGQKDTDSLPDYDTLDAVLYAYIEENKGRADMLAAGFDRAVVDKVIGLVDKAEWKRRQCPMGPKVSLRALKHDRQIPVTQHFFE